MQPSIGIVVLNWNGAADTLRCLASIRGLRYPNGRTLVVDNASAREDVRRLEVVLGTSVELLRAPENLGYAGGNTLGMQHLRERYDPDFYWILNNDVTVDPGALEALVQFATAHPGMGAIGCTILNSTTGRIYCFGGGTLNRWTGFDHLVGSGKPAGSVSTFRHLDYISGASLFLSRAAVQATDGFDPDFFLYSEEVDLCERLRRAGLGTGYAPNSIVHHAVARSTGYHSPTYVYYFLRGKIRYQRKWGRPWHWVTFVPAFLLGYVGGFLLKALLAGHTPPIGPIARALRDGIVGRWGRRLTPLVVRVAQRG